MADVKRYNFVEFVGPGPTDFCTKRVEADSGAYVLHDDYATLRAENQRLLDVETKLKGSIERRIKAVKTNPNNYYIDGHVEALELVLQWMNDPLRAALAENPIANEQGDKL